MLYMYIQPRLLDFILAFFCIYNIKIVDMVILIGIGIIAAVLIIYLIVLSIRGEMNNFFGELARVFLSTIIVSIGSILIPVFAIIILGWIGGGIVSIISIVLSFMLGGKIMNRLL